MDPIECPCCDDGVVAAWQVTATNEMILLCNECDSVWESTDELPGPSLMTVDQFLAMRGLPALRSQLQRPDETVAA